jgi:asparagine synthase (glutamine-hydrolysing)
MSSFTGVAALAPGADGKPISLATPPDEVGLGRCTRINTSASKVAHRQRVVTPDDVGERQPWPAWGGRGWVCFAGRLDDRYRLAQALDLERADGIPDGLLACRAVERWGEDAPGHLLGEYTLAAWHDADRRLLMASDPLGTRTVYYSRLNDLVLFSSTLRGLLAMPSVSRTIDQRYVADLLAMNIGDVETTFYRDIRRVISGTCLVMTADRVRTIDCHRFDPERRVYLKDDRAYVDAARDLLDQSIKDRMRALGPVPISASGGLDSACVAVSALAQGGPVTLLTAVPEPGLPVSVPRGTYGDERSLVEALVATFPGLRAEFHPPPSDTDWRPDSALILTACAVPCRTPAHGAWFEGVSLGARALGASSILTGQPGNRTLTWDGERSLISLLRQGRWLKLARELALGSGGHPWRLARMVKRHFVNPMFGGRYRFDDLTAFSALTPQALEEFDICHRMRQQGNDPGFVFSGDSRAVRIHQLKRNRGYWRADLMGFARSLHGLNFSMALGDVRLINFCLAIPEDQFLRDGTTRFLARRLLRAAGVPPIISENRLRGRQHPERHAHFTHVQPTFSAQIERLRRSPTARRLIDLDRLDHLIRTWPTDGPESKKVNSLSHLMECTLSIGAFIAWTEGTN